MKYVALLRAINVGGHVVKMDRLRQLFEELTLDKVSTFIASGNVIFESKAKAPALGERIERHLEKALGYGVKTFLRSAAEIAAVAEYRPFPAADLEAKGNSLYVMFLPAPLGSEARRKVPTFRTSLDEFHTSEREIYWLCRGRFSDSAVNTAPGLLGKAIGMPTTTRNMTTVRKLVAKMAEAPR